MAPMAAGQAAVQARWAAGSTAQAFLASNPVHWQRRLRRKLKATKANAKNAIATSGRFEFHATSSFAT